MKANELRIGNYVWDDTFYYSIDGIDDILRGEIIEVHHHKKIEDFYEEGQMYSLNLENVSGIPLTEEWLLKSGFRESHKGSSRFYDGNFDWMVYKSSEGEIAFYRHDETNGDIIYLTSLEYVHQLQNLYFALSGNELEII